MSECGRGEERVIVMVVFGGKRKGELIAKELEK